MKRLKENNGFTLIEILAVIIIISLFIGLFSNILFSISTQHKKQLNENMNLTDISFALKTITKDIRKSKKPVWISEKEIDLDGITYSFDEDKQAINKDDKIFVNHIKSFEVSVSNNKWDIEVTNLQNKSEKTEIIIRRGD
ncbi:MULTISPECIES: prepilin-type N-terminal cleavage/methylation domain-containing protein [unclassified Psychrobacillus]|uniref:prepilin-type N-terminal cleavage/methylation domain-containing protein n=1 Tax=unclassified Psychrobacillus TaxID=2636677 RepID=UPI0012AFC3BF|nr:prepilin-type N-terminal cleavage/methylation domain-containing protein [Bacillus sp. N3536]